ncbi:MAG: hypothetical protein JWP01_2597 [Myxococcales bacterium]|nr:hypothetical protein [Myxococcales bacterium]
MVGRSPWWRWSVLSTVAALTLACSSSQRARERSAREPIAFVEGTSVFGPPSEFVASDLPDVRATGLFPVPIVFEHPQLTEQLARTFLDQDLLPSRRITVEEAARFERPATILERFKKDFAGLFEDQL